jgi:hypothetical protein
MKSFSKLAKDEGAIAIHGQAFVIDGLTVASFKRTIQQKGLSNSATASVTLLVMVQPKRLLQV